MSASVSLETGGGVVFLNDSSVAGPPPAGDASPHLGGPSLITNGSVAGSGFIGLGLDAVDDLGLEIQALQARNSRIKEANEKTKAKTSSKARMASIEERLHQISREAAERSKSEKKSFWSKLFKWVAAIAAAIAGVVAAACSGGTTAAVAGVAIAAILAAEEVVSVVTDALVECGALSERAAMGIRAALGSIEDIVNSLAEVGAFGEHGETVAAVLNLVLGAAEAIVACAVGSWDGAAQIVGNVLSLTSTAVTAAQEALVIVAEEMGEQGKLSPEVMLALEIVAMCLDVAAAGCSFAEGSTDRSNSSSRTTRRRTQFVDLTKDVTVSSANAAAAGFTASADLHLAEADEARAMAQYEESMIEVAAARIASARDMLAEIFEDLEAVRDEVEAMFELGVVDPYANAGRAKV